jgi:hypothetical protein
MKEYERMTAEERNRRDSEIFMTAEEMNRRDSDIHDS